MQHAKRGRVAFGHFGELWKSTAKERPAQQKARIMMAQADSAVDLPTTLTSDNTSTNDGGEEEVVPTSILDLIFGERASDNFHFEDDQVRNNNKSWLSSKGGGNVGVTKALKCRYDY